MLRSEKLGLLCIPPLLWLRIDLRSDAIVASTGDSRLSLFFDSTRFKYFSFSFRNLGRKYLAALDLR